MWQLLIGCTDCGALSACRNFDKYGFCRGGQKVLLRKSFLENSSLRLLSNLIQNYCHPFLLETVCLGQQWQKYASRLIWSRTIAIIFLWNHMHKAQQWQNHTYICNEPSNFNKQRVCTYNIAPNYVYSHLQWYLPNYYFRKR